jgi:hypothetical protein
VLGDQLARATVDPLVAAARIDRELQRDQLAPRIARLGQRVGEHRAQGEITGLGGEPRPQLVEPQVSDYSMIGPVQLVTSDGSNWIDQSNRKPLSSSQRSVTRNSHMPLSGTPCSAVKLVSDV